MFIKSYINPNIILKVMETSVKKDEILDDFLEKGKITTIYGPAGSGKTFLCYIFAMKTAKKKKVIYIDTTKDFSALRMKQLDNNILDKLFLLKPKNFYEQKEVIENLKKNINKDIGLIIIDSMTYFYKLELKKNVTLINRVLMSQLNKLKEIAVENEIPIVITNSVYDDMEIKDNVKMLGGEILKRRSDYIIELKKHGKLRKAIMKKPKIKEIIFEIEEKGITPR